MKIQIHNLEWKMQRYEYLAYKKKLTSYDWQEIARLESYFDRHHIEYGRLKERVRVRRLIMVSRSMM